MRRPACAPRRSGVEHGRDHGRRAVEERDALGLDAVQDVLAVDLADDHLARAHRRERVGHAPAVAVEGRQRVQVHVALRHRGVPAERDGVEPAAPVRELDALGPRRGAGRVVDRHGRVLVGDAALRPRVRPQEEPGVGVPAEHEAVLDAEVPQRGVEVRIHQEHRRARVLHDVADLLGVEPEVDRHQHASPRAHAEEAHQEARRVRRDDPDALALTDAEVVERRRQAAAHGGELPVGHPPEPAARRRRLVHHGLPVAVHELRALHEIEQGERNDHREPPRPGIGRPRSLHSARRSASGGRAP